ncbi:glycerophosphodiester phosphodiesterase GDPDL3-like [Silene latifolia]|uniref:glycerophosphodiester phosphodiesterase GDPDL3-like n=1 Tax=Silene latifolia TaxID=37657 RepID=UPI003D778A16
MTSYLIRISKQLNISYISSPDIGFLRGLKEPFASTKTSLVFRFLDQDGYEPSTKKSYGFLLSNLTYIKTFASAILVPKVYVWPVDETSYLLPHTNLVADAHRNELQVFAYGFANDKINVHNYSYNPITEYLSFIDNGNFSVDGVVSDFPLTSSAARECFAHLRHSASVQAMPKPLVISNCGASGIYPGCTDLAYKKAISDGTDAIDCPVHMSKDGVPFCSSSVDLMANTFVYQTEFRKFASVINEIQSNTGIFSFSLNWSDIQALTPALSNPYGQLGLFGNPKYSKSGKIVSLSEFLDIAKNASSVSRVLIKMENARYLAENQGMSIVNSVLVALRDSHIQFLRSDERIMIQSTSSAVLKAMKGKGFELVYEVHEAIEVIDSEVIEDIKCFAHSVVLNKDSVFFNSNGFLRSWTHVVDYFHAFLIPVYIQGFRNEYVSIPYDFYYDPVVEINSYVRLARVEGLITAFPQTAVDYRNNRCLTLDKKVKYMEAKIPGELVSLVPDELRPALPEAFPNLTEGEVLEPALPPVVSNASLHHSPPPQVAATSTSALLPRQLTAFLSCLYIVLSL